MLGLVNGLMASRENYNLVNLFSGKVLAHSAKSAKNVHVSHMAQHLKALETHSRNFLSAIC